MELLEVLITLQTDVTVPAVQLLELFGTNCGYD
jgi:hypothetical protein